MFIDKISITDVRNLRSVSFLASKSINVFYGDNGSGKSSVLESLYLLALSRSFRSHKISSVIQHGEKKCVVFANIRREEDQDISLGIERHLDGRMIIRANGEPLNTSSDLIRYLPIQLINPDTFNLLEGGPKERRRLLDWGVFHVEPEFFSTWKQLNRCLKQRNSVLKSPNPDNDLLALWDTELEKVAIVLDRMRSYYIDRYLLVFKRILSQLIDLPNLSLEYYCGWNNKYSLTDILQQNREKDYIRGHTYYGPHRADIRIKINQHNAADILSRGQQKLVVCAIKIAQGFMHADLTQSGCVYLVDDLPSELDEKYRKILYSLLVKLDCQMFITGVDKLLFQPLHCFNKPIKMFHVKQGDLFEYQTDHSSVAPFRSQSV